MELYGKVSLVTGASRGIGRAIAVSLAEAGSDVAINYASNSEAAEAVAQQVRGLGRRARTYRADVADQEQINTMCSSVLEEFGAVHVLVNNAGITRDRSFLKLSQKDWDDVMRVNLDGPVMLTRALLPSMIEQSWGRIINITSIVAQMGNFGQSNYAAAKGAIESFTRTLAREVALKGITVNVVAPGFIETDMTSVVPAEILETVRKATPVGRLGRSEEVAVAVRFLAHPDAGFITGETIAVNGGMYMG